MLGCVIRVCIWMDVFVVVLMFRWWMIFLVWLFFSLMIVMFFGGMFLFLCMCVWLWFCIFWCEILCSRLNVLWMSLFRVFGFLWDIIGGLFF